MVIMRAILLTFALALGVGGCVPSSPSPWLVQPADPDIPVRSPRYATVTGGVKDYRVVEPKDWRELNRQVGPADDTQDRGQDSAAGARRGR
jgi:hypothetical protein